jgi:hypothetical protein
MSFIHAECVGSSSRIRAREIKDLLIVITGQAVGAVKTGCLDRLFPVVK